MEFFSIGLHFLRIYMNLMLSHFKFLKRKICLPVKKKDIFKFIALYVFFFPLIQKIYTHFSTIYKVL